MGKRKLKRSEYKIAQEKAIEGKLLSIGWIGYTYNLFPLRQVPVQHKIKVIVDEQG